MGQLREAHQSSVAAISSHIVEPYKSLVKVYSEDAHLLASVYLIGTCASFVGEVVRVAALAAVLVIVLAVVVASATLCPGS